MHGPEDDVGLQEPAGARETVAPVWHARLTSLLAEVSKEALQGEDLEAVLRRIVDCLVRNLPVAIASIILLDDDGQHFVQEVWAGDLDLYPTELAHAYYAPRCAAVFPCLASPVARNSTNCRALRPG